MLDAYNNPARWTDAGIWKAPDFDVRGYQKALDKSVGVSASGHSIVRLKWAWECRKWENTKWDEFGNATAGEWRQKYRALTVEIGNNEYVDIAPPRWILEERYEPEQYAPSWDATRYVHDPDECRRCQIAALGIVEESTSCVRKDVFGPAPREGWYNALPYIGFIAEHGLSNACCDRLWKESGEVCFGTYKIPDHKELEALRRAIRQRDKDDEVNPHDVLSPIALQRAMTWGLQQAKEVAVSKRNELKEAIRDEVAVHGASVIPPDVLAALRDARRRVPIHKSIFS